jgi:glycosyltransferase involved in cell wall biosynthesis
MKVVHLSTIHGPLDVRIFYKECRTLAKAGYEVHVVVFDPPDTAMDGILFHSIKKTVRHAYIPRIFSRLRHAYKAAKPLSATVYHFHDPELIPVGLLLKIGGARVIYDVHEDAAQEARSLNQKRPCRGWAYCIFYTACEWIAKRALDGMVAATPAIAKMFPAKKTVLVQNFPVAETPTEVPPLPSCERHPIIAYVGGISSIRGVKEIVRAMSLLTYQDARLAMAGTFLPPGLEQEVRETPGWKQVDFLGWLSRRDTVALLTRVRAGLVLFHPLPDHVESQPNKLYEYMAAGLPVIASDFPVWRTTYGPIGCCLFVDPLDPKAIADAIQWVLEHPKEAEAMGLRGAEAVRTRFNWESEARILLRFYEEVMQ